MANGKKGLEDKYIEERKKELKKVGAEMSHRDELAMRCAYSEAAVVFRALGRKEGDDSRKKKIIDALGLIEEEEAY